MPERPSRRAGSRASSWSLLLPLCAAAPERHRVELPGAPAASSASFSGLVPVPPRAYASPWGSGRSPAVRAHYWLTESERGLASDPVVLWLAGGPGASSLGSGFLMMGPWRLDDRSYGPDWKRTGVPTPVRNPSAWTTFAGLLLLEYADSGFSACEARCAWDLGSTTAAIAGFLEEFRALFPEHAAAPLWIAGESFAGNLVTSVAYALDRRGLPFAGVLHGNGAIGDYQGVPSVLGDLDDRAPPLDTGDMGPLDAPGHVEFWWRAGLTSTARYRAVRRACPSLGTARPDAACRAALEEMLRGIGDFEDLGPGAGWWNVYNIYDTCSDMPHAAGYASGAGSPERSETWYCGGRRAMEDYFNRADVQSALHVNRTKWVLNKDDIRWDHPAAGIDLLDTIKALAQRYPFLVYSGDVDAQIPHTSTEAWTSSLGFRELESYQRWTLNRYVQGYVTRYEHNFTFATVKGAGHMVPLYRPAAAHAMVSRFLRTQRLGEETYVLV